MTGTFMNRMKLFIDTSAFIALINSKDQFHLPASNVYRQQKENILRLTTNLVISETYSFLRYKMGYLLAMQYLEFIKKAEASGHLQIIYSNPKLEQTAKKILHTYHDHDLSYVDAVSFAVIETDKLITSVFTFDHHFHLTGRNVIPG